MKFAFHFFASLTVAALLFTFTPPAFAANHVVHMTTLYEFDPDYLEIQAGDTVTWHNDDETESFGSRSDTDIWDTGGVESEGDSEPVLFNTVGTFPYYDPTYSMLGMTGTIVVLNTAPSPTPALIVEPRLLAGGEFCFTITNLTAGKTTVIEASTNLTAWTPIATNVPAADSLDFTNSITGTGQFFRSFQIP